MVVSVVALLASGLTLFSGFGLGSILMPVMTLFFPVQIAIAATAIVHLANNFFKLSLFGKFRRNEVLFRFAFPAIMFSAIGAWVLTHLSQLEPIMTYTWFTEIKQIEVVKVVIAVLITLFAIIEIHPSFRNIKFNLKLLPIGGAISGLMGGLSGHQGAMRSAFLAKAGLTKEEFIGTGVTIACLVDITRLSVYGVNYSSIGIENTGLIVAACFSAFAGAFVGKQLVRKVTMKHIQKMVAISLILLSFALGTGLL